ncbi:MAG: hypothetical protein GKR89_01760 [Candidatus Latescibacteria bacterium]|nr:hypothetical protein [Candidatus Latescibacterota bacterium]
MAYFAVFSAQLRIGLQYRAAALSGSVGQVVFGLIFIAVLRAFYQSAPLSPPMPFADAVVYIWLGQAMLGMLPAYLGPDLPRLMRSGDIVFELLRPVDIYGLWFARAVAYRVTTVVLRAIPVALLAGLFFGLQPPVSWEAGLAWGVATLLALGVSCAMAMLFSLTLLWTVAGAGITHLGVAAVSLLSGMLVPLPFFPEWMQGAMDWLPFRSLYDIPFRLYLGHIPPDAAVGVLLQQAAWGIGLVLVGYAVLARGRRRLIVQGG